MLLDEPPSWGQRGRPQPIDEAEDFPKQLSRHRNLCQLERDVPAMADHFRTDFDQLFPQRGQRPVFLASGRCCAAFGKASVRMKLARL